MKWAPCSFIPRLWVSFPKTSQHLQHTQTTAPQLASRCLKVGLGYQGARVAKMRLCKTSLSVAQSSVSWRNHPSYYCSANLLCLRTRLVFWVHCVDCALLCLDRIHAGHAILGKEGLFAAKSIQHPWLGHLIACCSSPFQFSSWLDYSSLLDFRFSLLFSISSMFLISFESKMAY